MALLTFRVSLLTSVNPVYRLPPRYAQIFMGLLNDPRPMVLNLPKAGTPNHKIILFCNFLRL